MAFVWWNVLLALTPACAVCALHYHATGAVHVAVSVGIVGVAIAAISLVRLVASASGLRRAFSAA